MAVDMKTIILVLVAALVPISAHAQEWDGIYGGVTLGYTGHDATHTFGNGAPTDTSDPDGGLLGGFVGYGQQIGTTVFSVELGFEGSDASGTFNNPAGIGSSGKAELNWQGSIRFMMGMVASLGGKPAYYYGTAGLAYGDFDFRGGPAAGGGGFGANGYGDELDGWLVGFGVDSRLGGNLSLRTEYTYTDYGTARGTLAPGFAGVAMPVSVEQHAVRIGLRKDW